MRRGTPFTSTGSVASSSPTMNATRYVDITMVGANRTTFLPPGAAVSSTAAPGGKKVVRFAPTMVMSTYLVAFIVGLLEATEPVDVNGVPLRIVYPPGKAHLTPFALEVGAHALRFFT